MCGESKRLFNPPPQFSRLGILVYISPSVLIQILVCDVHVCVPLFVWVGMTFLPLYSYSLASVLCTCIASLAQSAELPQLVG